MTPDPDPDLIATRVQAVADVTAMHGGVAGEVATYLPGRRVAGVRIDDNRVEVHVVADPVRSLVEIAGDIRNALQPLVGDRTVDVFIGDVDDTGLKPGPALSPAPPADLRS